MKMRTETDVLIPMRDGCSVSADVFYPDDGQPHPALLHVPYQTRRSRGSIGQLLNPFDAAEHGFGVVIADARGTGRSEGEWSPFHQDAADGYDMVEWMAAQPWCDGKVGMYGNSGMGATTAQTALGAPPHLAAVMLVFTGANYYNGWAYRQGLFELGFANHWRRSMLGVKAGRMPEGPERDALRAEVAQIYANPWDDASRLPVSAVSKESEAYAPWYSEWLEHPSYDDYWNVVDAVANLSKLQVPILQLACWYDLFLPSQIELDAALAADERPEMSGNARLMVGPWAHNTYLGLDSTVAGARDFGPVASCSATWTMPIAFRWFDQHLKGGPDANLPRVRYFVMGDNEWVDGDTWPPPCTSTPLYLSSGGKANSRFGDGVLSSTEVASAPVDTYSYDPLNPVLTVGGAVIHQELGPDGVQDQSTAEERGDVLVYTSPLLPEGVKVAGPIRVVLHAASSAVDTDFAAKLVDVQPDGYCANIADGIVRARYRNSLTEPALLEPGAIEEYTIELGHVAHHFKAGHRIRVDVASSNFPAFARNLNTGIDNPHDAGPEDAIVAIQTVFHDADRPSRLVLPVVAGAI
jgi:putative CocE/NonD family hydrolase